MRANAIEFYTIIGAKGKEEDTRRVILTFLLLVENLSFLIENSMRLDHRLVHRANQNPSNRNPHVFM